MRDDLWTHVTNLVFNRLREINLYQTHFQEATNIASFSYNQFRPPNYGHGNMYGLIKIMDHMFCIFIQTGMRVGRVK